jgi:hypothetical protein
LGILHELFILEILDRRNKTLEFLYKPVVSRQKALDNDEKRVLEMAKGSRYKNVERKQCYPDEEHVFWIIF